MLTPVTELASIILHKWLKVMYVELGQFSDQGIHSGHVGINSFHIEVLLGVCNKITKRGPKHKKSTLDLIPVCMTVF